MIIKTFIKYFLIVAILNSLGGCCRYVDCLSDEYSCNFVFRDKTDGHDLVFGNNMTINRSGIKCYSLTNRDTTYYVISFIEYNSNISDSAINIKFYPETSNQIYLIYNNIEIDTITLKFNAHDTKCCGNITEISNININKVDYQINRNLIQIIK